MIRSIDGFHADREGDWVAELSCFHSQHIRHQPPFRQRPWVLDTDGRASHIGSAVECALCDLHEFPEDLTILGRAGPWNQGSVPDSLRHAHRTPEGQWGRLVIHHGAVDFQFEPEGRATATSIHLDAGSHQPIPPGMPHRVIVIGPVEVELEFWGRGHSAEPP